HNPAAPIHGGWQSPGRPTHLPTQLPEEPQGSTPAMRPRPGFGLPGPRRNRHMLSVDVLETLELPVGEDGIVLGVDPQNQPAVASLLRPTAMDVILVGSMWMAQVLSMRTVAIGARVAVETVRGPSWGAMAQAAGG